MTKNHNKIQKGSQVKVISGKYRNRVGKILKIINSQNQVIIENINIKTKHVKPRREEEKGERLTIEAPIHKSNITIDQT